MEKIQKMNQEQRIKKLREISDSIRSNPKLMREIKIISKVRPQLQ